MRFSFPQIERLPCSCFLGASAVAAISLLLTPACRAAAANPAPGEVAAEIAAQARAHRIPEALLDGLAWRESGWRQCDPSGTIVEHDPGHIGFMGVWAGDRKDVGKLRLDWRYNIAQAARQLELCWFRAPIIGDGRLEDSRAILESWYFALGRYGDGRGGVASRRFADNVLDAVASGGGGRWEPVKVSRLVAGDAEAPRNLFCPPVPWHFAVLPPRGRSTVVVSLDVPYINQVYDTPDDFAGGGSCGPASMTMVLAFFHKIEPRPISISDAYPHVSAYGGLIPTVHSAVCEPNLGAVHAKMLTYFRPYFPGAAIFYDARATPERVRAELDAGRPCILGTDVTSAGHIMVARGYLADGRFLVNDPAGDYYQAARLHGPDSRFAPTGSRYWNGGGASAIYDWDALAVRWVMTVGPAGARDHGDRPEDE